MLRLRPYKIRDAKTIVEWLGDERAFRQWCANRYDHYPINAEDMTAYYWASADIYPMTAMDDRGIVGHVALRYTDQEEKEVRLEFVVVDPAERGKGRGRELVQLATKYAVIFLGAEKVSLAVFEDNTPAYACYLAAGFRDVTTEESRESYTVLGERWRCCTLELDGNKEEARSLMELLGLSRRDMVTGMYNQRGLLDQLEKYKAACLQSGDKLLLVNVDIDKLSNINNIYGHSEGDVAIQTVAEILKDSLSEHETAARLGSDEFVVAMLITGDAERIVDSLMHAIVGRMENYNQISDKEYSLALNYSYLVVEPDRKMRVQDILDDAFSQKRIVKNNRRTFSGIREVAKEQDYDPAEEKLVNEILDKNSLHYDFQPIVDARTGDIYGYEALMRAGENNTVPPYVVLKYAIKCQRLYDVERATFNNVLSSIVVRREHFTNRKVFVNSIPGYQLDTADYEKLRREYGAIMKQLVVEVIEQSELNDVELDMLLSRSENDGFGIAIDDYGTGYSNTSSLLRYLPNCLKIDRLLITNIQEEPKKQHFVKGIIEFAHDNGFLALAEGVETGAEMRAVIHMGVDLIQGFYTARPSADILQELPAEIKSEIVNASTDNKGQSNRKIFMVTKEKKLPLMRLALEQYTGMLLSDQRITLVGNQGYTAGMNIKIKDGSNCHLTLRNVHLESVEELPCIDIGKNARLTLSLEGDNELDKIGIRVPEGSSLTVEGSGNLKVAAQEIQCYGIGNSCNAGVGEIFWESSGTLKLQAEGNECIALGGGIYRQGRGIQIGKGNIEISVASEKGIGVGCYAGALPIDIQNCRIRLDVNAGTGLGIGSIDGDQNIHIANSHVEIVGSGSRLCGIGSIEKTGGLIHIEAGKAIVQLSGQNVGLVGNAGGDLTVKTQNCRLELKAEGSRVWGIGSMDQSSTIQSRHATYDINVHAGEYMLIGARDDKAFFDGGERLLKINED